MSSFHLEGMFDFFFDECVPHNVTSRWRLYHRTASLLIRSFLNHFFLRLPNFVKVLKIDEIPVSFFFNFFCLYIFNLLYI